MKKLTQDELTMCADLGISPDEYIESMDDESTIDDVMANDHDEDDLAAIADIQRQHEED